MSNFHCRARRLAIALSVIGGLFWSAASNADTPAVPDKLAKSVLRVVALAQAEVNDENVLLFMGHGSVFVVAPGIVVTNAHVINGGRDAVANLSRDSRVDFAIRFWVADGGTDAAHMREAQVIKVDEHTDLAVLRVEGLERQALPIFTGDLPKGLKVAAIGYPGKADLYTWQQARKQVLDMGIKKDSAAFAMGETEAFLRLLNKSLEPTYSDGGIERTFTGSWDSQAPEFTIIQHRAEFSQGNSGGPLVDLCGSVVGVNTEGSNREADLKTMTDYFFASHAAPLVELLKSAKIEFAEAGICVIAPSGDGTTRTIILAVAAGAVLLVIMLYFVMRGQIKALRSTEDSPTPPPPGLTPTKSWILQGSGKDIAVTAEVLQRGGGNLVIGTDPDLANVVLGDDAVSGRHARLIMDGGLRIEDLNATNATAVNGRKLLPFAPETLADGDRITLGKTHLSVTRG